MTASQKPTPVSISIDEQGQLACDCFCVRCGYNLRGLSPDHVCPECATPIGKSVQGDYLQFSDPEWVEKLASGMNWVVAGIVLAFLTGTFSFAGFRLVGGLAGQFAGLSFPGILVAMGVQVVLLVGYWKVTKPDPAKGDHEIGLTARRLVRIWVVSGLFLIPMREPLQRLSAEVSIIVQILSIAIGIMGLMAICVYGARLAERVPDLRLARETRNVMWGLIVCVGLFFLSSTVMTKLMGLPISTWPPSLAFVAKDSVPFRLATGAIWAVGMGAVVCAIWGIVLVFQYRKALQRCAKLARATWTGAEG